MAQPVGMPHRVPRRWARRVRGERQRLGVDLDGRLPDVDLVELDDLDIAALAAALEDLAPRRADARRTFGRTASAKLLFALRPATVTAWDDAIARRPGVAGDFGADLRDARVTARTWVDQAAGGSVPQIVGRPDSTLAKIVDEVLYLTCTRGLV